MARIGLIDVDSHNYPNLCLMKLSAWHKAQGDHVEWYDFCEHYDVVYQSKVFSKTYTTDNLYHVNADKVIKGGTGYCIETIDGKEIFHEELNTPLPAEIEHIMPDYSIYPQYCKNTAYGFLTRGCPRGCKFCIVGKKEGMKSVKVADLTEFWSGQKKVVLNDPNILACKDWKELLQQLINSKAEIHINQGMDIRLMTEEKALMLKQIKQKEIHFAWDRYEDKDLIVPKLKMFSEVYGLKNPNKRKHVYVYTITNFNTTLEQDLDRCYTLREMGFNPFIMIYNKPSAPKVLKRLAWWCNKPFVFWAEPNFSNYNDR